MSGRAEQAYTVWLNVKRKTHRNGDPVNQSARAGEDMFSLHCGVSVRPQWDDGQEEFSMGLVF